MVNISVVVAVYAAEKYLKRCLDSLLEQNFENFEILLIDDGSKDSSGMICDEYARRDARVKVFHKENGGVGSARQAGLDQASGEYVIHADPDDWLDPTMLKDMYDFAVRNNADMVVCDFYTEYSNRTEYESLSIDSLDHVSFFKGLFGNIHAACWNKLVRRTLFDKYSIKFPAEMVVWEDSFVNCQMALHPIKISYLPKAFYHYDRSINSESLVDAVSARKLNSMFFFISTFEQILREFSMLDILNEKKILAKRNAFKMASISKRNFVEIYPEIDFFFKNSNKKIDKLIWLALDRSWILSRFILFFWKIKNELKQFLKN